MKAYRFLFDSKTGVYQGIVREPFPENCTDIEPFFNYDCKTVFDFSVGSWKLVNRLDYWESISRSEMVNDYKDDLKPLIEKQGELICSVVNELNRQRELISDLQYKLTEINNDVYMKNAIEKIKKDIIFTHGILGNHQMIFGRIERNMINNMSSIYLAFDNTYKIVKANRGLYVRIKEFFDLA